MEIFPERVATLRFLPEGAKFSVPEGGQGPGWGKYFFLLQNFICSEVQKFEDFVRDEYQISTDSKACSQR